MKYLFFVTFVLFLLGCKTEQLVNSPTNIPCKGKTLTTTSDVFRETAIGESLDQQGSVSKAFSLAQQNLAQKLLTRVKVGTKYYAKDVVSKQGNGKALDNTQTLEYQNKLESELSSASTMFLSEIGTVCQETYYNNKQGVYKTYMTIEVAKDAFYKGLIRKAGMVNGQYQLDFDEEEFSKYMKGQYEEFQREYDKEFNRIQENN